MLGSANHSSRKVPLPYRKSFSLTILVAMSENAAGGPSNKMIKMTVVGHILLKNQDKSMVEILNVIVKK